MSLAADQESLPGRYRYHVYGLIVDSAIAIPELTLADHEDPDATIELGPVPEHLSEPIGLTDWFEYEVDSCLFKFDGVGRFLIEHGRTITIDRRENRERNRGEGAPSADVRAYLLGSACGALLHQRGWLPMHVSAVQCERGVFAFTGESGAGKSTLAGWLHHRFGWPIVSDDVSALKPGDKFPQLHPGPRKLKLWQDAVDYLDFHDEGLVQDLSNTPKFQLYLSDRHHYQPSAMRSLVVLDRCKDGENSSLERLTGSQAFQALMDAVYRPFMAEWFRDPTELMNDLASLCTQIDVFRFSRPWSLEQMEQQLEPLLDEILTPESKRYAT